MDVAYVLVKLNTECFRKSLFRTSGNAFVFNVKSKHEPCYFESVRNSWHLKRARFCEMFTSQWKCVFGHFKAVAWNASAKPIMSIVAETATSGTGNLEKGTATALLALGSALNADSAMFFEVLLVLNGFGLNLDSGASILEWYRCWWGRCVPLPHKGNH